MQKLEATSTTTVSFASDNKTLLNDQGAIQINSELIPDNEHIPETAPVFPTNDTVIMNENWVQQGFRNLLWLPEGYCGSYTAIYGNMIAIGRHSGQVDFLQLGHP